MHPRHRQWVWFGVRAVRNPSSRKGVGLLMSIVDAGVLSSSTCSVLLDVGPVMGPAFMRRSTASIHVH